MSHPVNLDAAIRDELAGLAFSFGPEHPLDLLFSHSGIHSQAAEIRSHRIRRPLPAGSLLRLSEHVAIVSPELCFAQIARDYSLGQLMLCGCEICGTYLPITDDPRPEERPRLTSASKLQAYLRDLGAGREAKAAQAAHRVFDDAASQMEARLALLLSLPQTMGGFGLPRPRLNPSITLGVESHRVYPCDSCRMDLYWRQANLDVEYDGSLHNEERRDRDAARIVALRMEKVDVMVLRSRQVHDVRSMVSIAQMIAGKLGCRIRVTTQDFERRHRQLRRELRL